MKTNIKLRVTPEQSKAVQKICFNNKIYWATTGSNFEEGNVRYIFIAIDVMTLTYESTFFHKHEFEEIDADLFIRTNGTCVESKCEHPGINNTTGKCIACGEHIDKSEFKSTEETAIEPECQFAKYGFEKPDFECEILKYFAEDNTLVGYYKTEDGTVYAESWHYLNGRADCGVNNYNTKVHLIPIKKPWYETCTFPCIIMADYCMPIVVKHYEDGYVYDFRDNKYCVKAWRLLANNEIEGLKQ